MSPLHTPGNIRVACSHPLPLIDWILHGITNRIYPDPDPSVSHFQNPKIGFQNPRLPFSRKTTALSMPGFYRRASRIQKFASIIRNCHFFRKKNSLEHARILSESFQNPRLPFFQKKNIALSTPGFYRKTSRYHILPRYHIFTFVIHVQITISQNIRYSNISHDLIGGQ